MARVARLPWGALVLVAAFLVPTVGSRFYTFLANDVVIWALFATSLNLLVGYAGLPSLGQGGLMGVGAFAAGVMTAAQLAEHNALRRGTVTGKLPRPFERGPLAEVFDAGSSVTPELLREREDLGPLWKWMPVGALHHDPNAYRNAAAATVHAAAVSAGS